MSTNTAQTEEPHVEAPEEPMDMGALLDAEASHALRRGEIVEGMVMGASQEGLIVDVGAKMEALIPQNEMLSLGVDGQTRLKAGDTVHVMVLQPSSAEGHAIVSLDRARGEQGWDVLAARYESGEIFEAEVTGHNRGGILVNIDGVNAFIPLSQVDSVRRDDPDAVNQLANLVGNPIRLKVIELNRKRNRAILSERAAMQEFRKEQKDRVLDELKEGDIYEGRVSSITDFGVFIDLGGADGLAHMTELSWERGKKARDLYNIGDTVQAYILKIDHENKKISLSLKRAQPEKWDSTVQRFVVGQILIGRVTKLMTFGAFVRLDGPVEGLIHISELSNRRIQHPREVVKEGDVVPVKLVRVERDRHRLGLSLRQARADAEAMGFEFDAHGAVTDFPDDVREQFGLGERDASQPAPRTGPRTTQEVIERAVADHEPVSAFAHAFAQALENAESSSPVAALAEEASAGMASRGAVAEVEFEAELNSAAVVEAEAEVEVAVDSPVAIETALAAVATSSDEANEAAATGESIDESQDSTGATVAVVAPDTESVEGEASPDASPSDEEDSTAGAT